MSGFLGPSGVPLGPLEGRVVPVFLEDGFSYHRLHRVPWCSGALEAVVPLEVPFLELAWSRQLCAACLASPGVLLSPAERSHFDAASRLASAALSLSTFLSSSHSGWTAAAALSEYLQRLEAVDVDGIDSLESFRSEQASAARRRLASRLRWLRRQGDTRLLWLFAAHSLRSRLGHPWSSLALSALEDQLLRLLAYTLLPLPARLQPRHLALFRERTASAGPGTPSVAGPLVGADRDLATLFRVAALRWGTGVVEPAVLVVPALVADVLGPVAPTLCGGALPESTVEVFLALWDAESDPLPVLEAAGALLA